VNEKQKHIRRRMDELERENSVIRVRRAKASDVLADDTRESIKKAARFPTYASRSWFRGSGRKKKNRFSEKMAIPKKQ
jgi:hypothetical protein